MCQQLFGLFRIDHASGTAHDRFASQAAHLRAPVSTVVVQVWAGAIISLIFCSCTAESRPPLGTGGAAAASTASGCGTISEAGSCQNNVISWCYKGSVLKIVCGTGGGSGCSVVNGSWVCTGPSAAPGAPTSPSASTTLKACIDGCKSYCKTAPCGCIDQHGGNACALQCDLDRLNCAVQCPCGCYDTTPTGIQPDIDSCSKGCLNVCAAENAKCTGKCSSYGCFSQCSSIHSSCIIAAGKVCR